MSYITLQVILIIRIFMQFLRFHYFSQIFCINNEVLILLISICLQCVTKLTSREHFAQLQPHKDRLKLHSNQASVRKEAYSALRSIPCSTHAMPNFALSFERKLNSFKTENNSHKFSDLKVFEQSLKLKRGRFLPEI